MLCYKRPKAASSAASCSKIEREIRALRALISLCIVLKRAANLCGLEPQLKKLEFIIYLPKLRVQRWVIDDD